MLKQKKEMKDLVCKYFIRVCKNHDMYSLAKNQIITFQNCNNTPFGCYKNIFELSDKLHVFTEKEYKNFAKDNTKYEKVTLMINHLLHFFLETKGIEPMRLRMLGQEIFDLVCYNMYGDTYVNDLKKIHTHYVKDEEVLFKIYVNLLQHNKNIKNLTFEEFIGLSLNKLRM